MRKVAVMLGAAAVAAALGAAAPSLEEGFAAPPHGCRPEVWWWFHECASAPDAAIVRDLEAMKVVGLSAFHIYGGSVTQRGWLPKAKLALREAHRLGLDAYLMIGSAGCGHPDTPHRLAPKELTFTRTNVVHSAAGTVRVRLPRKGKGQTPKNADGSPELYADIACLAVPMRDNTPVESVRDVSRFLDSSADELVWPDAPTGRWAIVRCAYVPKVFGWMGCYIDHMSRTAMDEHWGRVVTPFLAALGKDERAALKGVLCDSWEAETADWTDAFAADFRRLRGYDPVPWLPARAGLKLGTPAQRARFMRDFDVTRGELVAENHYAYKRELAHRAGLVSVAEAAGPHQRMGDVRMMQGRCDVAMGEFWMPSDHRPEPSQRFMLRDAATAAHVYGIPEVLAEAFTTIGTYWTESPETMKPCADRAFCDGLTRVCYHGMMLSPSLTDRPGKIRTAAQHYNPQNTWFMSSGAFNTYLARCSWMLSQGRFAADALVYAGDAINLFASLKDPADALGPGYDYDFCPTELLAKARTDNGCIVLPSGMRYRALVIADKNPAAKRMDTRRLPPPTELPPVEPFIPEEGAAALARLEKAGVPILRTRAERKAWTAENAPDFRVAEGADPADIDWIHRVLPDGDAYFIANRRMAAQDFAVELRAVAPAVELWDAVTGGRVPVAAEVHGRQTRVRLELPPYGSVFVVFRPRPTAGCGAARPVTVSQRLDGPWQVSFDRKWGGPDHPLEFKALQDWTSNADPDVRHYSGTAVYTQTVTPDSRLMDGGSLYVDLGEVRNVADVYVDGRRIGTAWTRPFRLEIPRDALGPDAARKFTLEVRVTNLWPNRLIADSALPPAKRLTRTNINPYKPGDALLPSGLIGPVRLVAER